MQTLPPQELRYWLALHRADGVGARTFARLLTQFESPRTILECDASTLRNCGLTEQTIASIQKPDWEGVDDDLEWMQQQHHYIFTWADQLYPPALLEIASPPALLFVIGQPEVLSKAQIAMVGSRNPTPGGAQTARDFAAHLSNHGFVVTSGLANGIDSACHQGALDAHGTTIAVTGTGLDRVYPATNRELAHQICENGALVSEFSINTPPKPGNFPQRNRIISGLSVGTLVVEAALKSGSLITARQALNAGREVFAIPGSIHNPLARGCHWLIRQGAKLVETGEDVISELPPTSKTPEKILQPTDIATENTTELDSDYQLLLQKMGYDPASIDGIVQQCGLTAEEVSSMMLNLELQGLVARCPGGSFMRKK